MTHHPRCFAAHGLDLLDPLTRVCICDRINGAIADARAEERQQWEQAAIDTANRKVGLV